jgi:predicted pyridoxine 5'-phosphate oxidase superfamily flavin-nucleotide-binding protein
VGILTDDMKRVVRQQRLAFVATVCADNTPNLSPKGTIAVWDDDHLVFVRARWERHHEAVKRGSEEFTGE